MTPMTQAGGVIVTYFPDADFPQRLAAVARETNPVFVIDNSADAAVRERLAAACSALGCTLLANPENRGLAAALNTGFTALAAQGLHWGVAFDQDSTPEPGMAMALLEVASGDRRGAIVGSNWHDVGRPGASSRHLRRHPHLRGWFERSVAHSDLADISCVITSGTLFRLDVWRELGGFDDALFLDLVDTEFCLRARASGYTIAVAARARLAHHRGAKRPVRLLGRTYWPAFMPPLRLRYLFRNRALVMQRHGWCAPHWLAFELVYATKIIAEVVFIEDQKFAKLVACALGTWEGLRGESGRIIQR